MSKITFQKRQKEMKRQEKAKMKAERRAQRKTTPSEPEEVIEVMTGPRRLDPDMLLDLDTDV